MAERRRALGRGLEALMPAAQAEPIPRRPTDVFFPEGPKRGSARPKPKEQDVSAVDTEPQEARSDTETRSSAGARSASDIAATLLAPSKRGSKQGRKAFTRGPKRTRTPAVSRETSSLASVSPVPVVEASAPTAVPASAPEAVVPQVSEPETVTPEALKDKAVAPEVIPPAPQPPAQEVQPEPAAQEAVSRETDTLDQDSDLVAVPGATFGDIPLDRIDANPRQPRHYFDDEDIEELAASIREVGLLQPIVVRRSPQSSDDDPHYELIMGERRTRAARVAGLETIPAIVRYTDDEDLLRDALLENLHRVQLNPLEEAAAYRALLEDFGCTHAELSKRIARSRSQISNTLRLMKLPALVQRRVAAGVLSAGHARALLGLPDAGAMERLAQRVVAEGISVRATEELVAMHDEAPEAAVKTVSTRMRSTPLPALSTRLSDAFETRVKVTRTAKKGKIMIEFAGDEDLARIVDALAPGTSLAED